MQKQDANHIYNKAQKKYRFLELFEMELQNRAASLKGCEAITKKLRGEDAVFYEGWLVFERFLKEKYKPYSEKYNLSQEPKTSAKIEAGIASFAMELVPDKVMFETILDETISYCEKLKELKRVAPDEDTAFFSFVLAQEELQVEALKLKVQGQDQEAIRLLDNFMESN